MWSIEKLQQAWRLAARLHDGQKYAGPEEGEQIEYLNHIGSVTFEILNALQHAEDLDADLAIQCAVLHDTIEDTQQSYAGIVEHFGEAVANGVMALTKNEGLPDKATMMQDSLQRIKEQPKAVWAVKMADRICNLQPPPYYWTREKKEKYQEEARVIHRELREGHAYLAARLAGKIEAYGGYIG